MVMLNGVDIVKIAVDALAAALLLLGMPAYSQWDQSHLDKAKGQTVYWNAWGGDERINAYIDWVGDQVQAAYGVRLRHVKLSNTADAVARVRTEVAAGRRQDGGSIDLIWINGENFATMKADNLLYGPFVDALPNFALVDTEARPTIIQDFTIPTDGYEAPWGMAQFNFMVDTAVAPDQFADLEALAQWAAQNPGRFSYPRPPDFLGTTFLKQVMLSQVDADFSRPFDGNTAQLDPVFAFLDDLHPHLWRKGQSFPNSGPVLRDMLANLEVDIALSFNPAEAASLVLNEEVDASVRAIGLGSGTVANTHFVAIPVNSQAKEGAMLVADFLLSPLAQSRKASLTHWGDPSVIAYDRLKASDRALFDAEPIGGGDLGPALTEPDPSWMTALEQLWTARYGS